ncbi:hypothetical protein BsWGS_15617 [Bradybaena similaris]
MADPLPVRAESSFSSLSDDLEMKSNEEVANDMAADFTKFLNFNVVKEELKFNDSVEMMLTKLDEFFSLVDMIRSDTTLCLSTTLPDIQAKCAEMEAIFEKIDKLEGFVDMVKECVASTEEKVARAESDLGTVGGLVKKLTSFVSKKKSPIQSGSRGKRNEYVPPNIFCTEEFFDHSMGSEHLASSAALQDPSFNNTDGSSLKT